MSAAPILLFLLFAGVVIALIIYGVIAAAKRRNELAELAARLGLSFNPGSDRNLASNYGFLNQLDTGSNRYAFNTLSGTFQQHPVLAFDYHYETHSTGNKGQRQTHHHYFSVFVLLLPISLPEIRIYREGFFSKVGQFLGFEDIDFESAEFSRTFCVRAKDRKVAYDICNPRMIEYLLENRDLTIEIDRNALALIFSGQLRITELERNLRRLLEMRSLMPGYLFANPSL